MKASTQERLSTFRARNLQYLRLGYDRMAAVRFVVDAAGELRGPALDIGTGKGFLAIELARRDLEVVTVDVDTDERELARLFADEAGIAEYITFATGDAARLPYADGRFGCVAMMDVLHHLKEPAPVLREMARVITPGGVVVIADFDEEGFELVSRVHRAEGHEHPRTSTTVSSALGALTDLGLERLASTRGYLHEVAIFRKVAESKEPHKP